MRALPGCHRNEQKEVGGWSRRQVGRREGRRQRWGAGSWLPQFWCCCLPELAVEGREPKRTEPPAWAPGPLPAATTEKEDSKLLRPSLAQQGQCAPTCPWLGTKTGPGRHPDGDSWKRLHGEWGPGTNPAFPPAALGSKQKGLRGQGHWMGWEQPAFWRHSSEPEPSPSGGLPPDCLSSSVLQSLSPPLSQALTVETLPSRGKCAMGRWSFQ